MSLPPTPSPGGGPLTRTWRLTHRLRSRWYAGRSGTLPRPTVSIGNLHWGGTGKTPLVEAVARHVQSRGRQVAILSRGYGRTTRGPLVVSRGDGPETGPGRAGDEPYLLAARVPGIHLVVAERRLEAGRIALGLDPAPDLFLLDDGFSHLALARDLDLLAIPVDDPWGAGRLPPTGRLREPLESSRRAHGLLVTGREVSREAVTAIGAFYRDLGFDGEVFGAPVRTGQPRSEDGGEIPPGERVVLVTGIARPGRAVVAAEEAGLRLADHLEFPDHHDYPPASLARIRRRVEVTGARHVVTTTKDLGKLRSRLEAPLAALPVEAVPEPGFWHWLEERLAREEKTE